MADEKQQTPIERAKARVKRRDALHKAMYEDHINAPRFGHLSDDELIALAQSPKPLRREELAELDAVWFTRFGEWLCEPAGVSAQPTEPAPEPTEPALEDNDMMTRRAVAKRLMASIATVQRMEKDGRLPKALRNGRARRHLVRDVDALVEKMDLDRQRHAQRNRR